MLRTWVSWGFLWFLVGFEETLGSRIVSEDGGCICLRFCRGESSGETRALLEEGSGLAHGAEARPGWLEQRPVTEPTWQRQEAGGQYMQR